ncbi:MAG: YihY/virulence factor BrkB family protein [Dehalococcoidia bacterium]|nr:YihY/virulence factor BrkB family protein [Dehalococcoidia bacterium]HRC62562.1 YihY/virulence factor BrkB family protein [Dehalococcoidia bacterium]
MAVPTAPPSARPRRIAIDWRLVAGLLRRATVNFVEDRCTVLAAAISYFALFSLFPLVLLAAAVFGIVLRDPDVQTRVLNAVVDAIPVEAPSVSNSLRALADLGPTLSVVATIGTLWTASALAAAIRNALDIVFDVRRPRALLQAKILDYLVLIGVGALFLTSLALTTAWRVAQTQADVRWGLLDGNLRWLWDLGAVLIPAVMTFLMFLLLYRALPHGRTRLLHIWPGALLAAVAFELAKALFATYLANFANYDVVYGSLGGVIALLFWVYVSANILLFGAEVAAEVSHVMRGEPRRGHTPGDEGDWRSSLLTLLRGLVLAPGEGEERRRRW